jgi:hypothetical protein
MYDLPVSTSIVMRPIWARRQKRRYYNVNQLPPPTNDERRDAIRILSLPDAMLAEMPALHAEAQRVMCEATEHDLP